MTNDRNDIIEVDVLPLAVREDGELADIATAIKECQSNAVLSFIEMGKLLEAARQRLSRHRIGIFGEWIKCECGLSKNTAARAARAFREFGEINWAKLAPIEISALHALSTPSCPPEARADALAIATAGKPVTHQLARELVAKHLPPKEPEKITALDLIDSIRKAMRVIYENAPEELRSIVAPKFRDFANELERTGDLSW